MGKSGENKIIFDTKKTLEEQKEFLISILLRFEKEHGRIPYFYEMTNRKGYISSYLFYDVFGSWAEAIKQTPFKTRIDEHFFSPENMNLRKWYIAGYIIGDGNINNNRLYIYTTEKDKENFFDIHKYMNIKSKIYDRQRWNGLREYQIAIKNNQWVNDLALYGIVPNKSLISYIPLDYLKTPEEEAAICRGIFDSDGGIYYQGKVNNFITIGNCKAKQNFFPVFEINGTKQLCEDYLYLLKKNCDIDERIMPKKTIFRFNIHTKEKCQKIYDFLYGHDNFYIKRKKERFKMLLNGTFSFEDDPYKI